MRCEEAQEQIVLAQYGELADGEPLALERHIAGCEDCRREWNAMLALGEELASTPVLEPTPNLLAASRMRLDEALDALPARSPWERIVSNTYRWLGFLRGAPALATLLAGVGFLGGSTMVRWQVAHAPRPPQTIIMEHGTQGGIESVSGIVQTPDTDVVQVNYNRLIPETVQGSLNDPQIRQLLMLGTKLATNNEVHADSVAVLANACRIGRGCDHADSDGKAGVRATLVSSLRYDKSPAVRLKALAGLQPYVADDQRVRDALVDAVMHDTSPEVRGQAISVLSPVGADFSVREAMRTVSAQDTSPAIRTASYQVLQSAADIQ